MKKELGKLMTSFFLKLELMNFQGFVKGKYYNVKNNVLPYPKAFEIKHKRIIIFAPHPDDELFGLGGFVLKNKKNIKGVYFFSNGNNNTRVLEVKQVAKKLGIEIFFLSNKSRVEEKEAFNLIKKVITDIKPNLVCIPSFYETHTDHMKLLIAFEKYTLMSKYKVSLLMYEIWNTLIPNYVVDCTLIFKEKKELMKLYKSQIKAFPYIDFIESLNRYRGIQIGKKYGEGVIYIENSLKFFKK